MLCVCSVIDHRWRQNVMKRKKGTRGNSRVCQWCRSYHIFMRGVKLVVKLFFVKLFFSSIIEDFQNFLTNFYDVRISVAQATQLRLLNVWTIRQLQCIHLAFEPKQKIKSNRSSLFPVGRRSPCATITVINRQFDALFEIEIFLYLRLKSIASHLTTALFSLIKNWFKLALRLSSYACTRGSGECKCKSLLYITKSGHNSKP